MQLNVEQINEFKKNGFLVLRNFANPTLCEAILEKAKWHLEQKIAPIESEQEYSQITAQEVTVRRLRQVYQREAVFQEWMTHKAIQPILQQLLNDTPVLTLAHHNSIMTKMPKESTRTYWHQDVRYWNFENDNLLSVWLALGDEYLDNGLLEFIPASHLMTFSKEQFDTQSNFLDDHPRNIELIKTKVHTLLHQGDVVLFHCKTLHHASKNNTLNPKISFVYTLKARGNNAIKNTRSDFDELILE
ncbi:MAG: phytanoyl-CoA dioxygenase family protein [Arcobacteraceae bacterium]